MFSIYILQCNSTFSKNEYIAYEIHGKCNACKSVWTQEIPFAISLLKVLNKINAHKFDINEILGACVRCSFDWIFLCQNEFQFDMHALLLV